MPSLRATCFEVDNETKFSVVYNGALPCPACPSHLMLPLCMHASHRGTTSRRPLDIGP